jgi:hypothetical protein
VCGHRGPGERAPRARARRRGVAGDGRFVAHRRVRATDVTRVEWRGAGFGKHANSRSTFVTHAIRDSGGRHRARSRADTRTASHARAARASTIPGQHDVARAATARALARRGAVLSARCADSRSSGVASDSRHTHGSRPCYLRTSPVVSSVPVTGRTVTMPDDRAGSRISSSLQLSAGLRCSTPRQRDW